MTLRRIVVSLLAAGTLLSSAGCSLGKTHAASSVRHSRPAAQSVVQTQDPVERFVGDLTLVENATRLAVQRGEAALARGDVAGCEGQLNAALEACNVHYQCYSKCYHDRRLAAVCMPLIVAKARCHAMRALTRLERGMPTASLEDHDAVVKLHRIYRPTLEFACGLSDASVRHRMRELKADFEAVAGLSYAILGRLMVESGDARLAQTGSEFLDVASGLLGQDVRGGGVNLAGGGQMRALPPNWRPEDMR